MANSTQCPSQKGTHATAKKTGSRFVKPSKSSRPRALFSAGGSSQPFGCMPIQHQPINPPSNT